LPINELFLINEKRLNEMNIFQKDEIGLPSTVAAILANVFQSLDLIKIKNEKALFEQRKNEKGQ